MRAKTTARSLPVVVFIAILSIATHSEAASYRTANFLVTADSANQARVLAQDAEQWRRKLAVDWFGTELPVWNSPCPIHVAAGDALEPYGRTSYQFLSETPVGWRMQVEGPWRTIRHSVLPHEVTHCVFATYFGEPIPRWAEEGVCVIGEHKTERVKLERSLSIQLGRGSYSVTELFAVRDYPREITSFYSHGYSLVNFLIDRGGKRKFVAYLQDGSRQSSWADATRKHYGFEDLSELQRSWLQWAAAREASFTRKDSPLESSVGKGATDLLVPRSSPPS